MAEQRYSFPPYFIVVSLTTMVLMGGGNLLVPVLPSYARDFGISASEVGVVIGAFAVGRLFFDFAGGALADRFGVRPVAVFGCAVTCLAAITAGLTGTFWVLLVSRVFQGIGSALYMSAATTLVVQTLPKATAGRWMSLFQGTFMVGLALGPVFGGVLAESFGDTAPFFGYAVLSALGMVASAILLPKYEPKIRAEHVEGWHHGESDSKSTKGSIGDLLRNSAFSLSLLVLAVSFMARSGIRDTAIPLFSEDSLGLDAGAIGSILSISVLGQVLAMWHAGRALDLRGRRVVIVVSMFGTAAAVGLLAAASSVAVLIVSIVLIGVASAYATTGPTVVLIDVAENSLRGKAVGLQRMSIDIGMITGPVATMGLIEVTDYSTSFLLSAALVTCVGIVTMRWLPETRPR